jgi:regulator of protease activity HflC (stomatin/prohibitin superfamily)
MNFLLEILAAAGALGLAVAALSLRVVKQYERGVVFRFGRVRGKPLRPGLAMLIPVVDRLEKVNMQIITMPVPAQDGITRDNITVRVDAVVYFSVMDAVRAAVDVQDYVAAIGQVAQTSLRSIIGKSDLDDLLCDREHLNQGMEIMIDSPALDWGVHIERVEIKDVSLPDAMKRSMSRQAEAERERRARIITADGELQASEKLAQAAEVMSEHPAALQLRLLQTVVEVAAERNSTLVLPFPVELLRFLERATPTGPDRTDSERESSAGRSEDLRPRALVPEQAGAAKSADAADHRPGDGARPVAPSVDLSKQATPAVGLDRWGVMPGQCG